MLPAELAPGWRSTARLFRDHAEESVARAYEACAKDLERILTSLGDTPLTLQEAAEESGYSADHLGRLVREGSIPNSGRHGSPRIARRDLPRKSEMASQPERGHLSPTQIVRSVINAGV